MKMKNGNPVFKVTKNKTDNPRYRYSVLSNNDGEWEYGIQNKKRIPYHLPQIIEGEKDDKTIVICGGEKDADTVSELCSDFISTTAISSSFYKWEYDFNRYLSRNSKILILQDDTEEAEKFVINTKKNLSYKVKNFAVLKIKKLKSVLDLDVSEITDISDLRLALSDDEKLVELLNTADKQLRATAWIYDEDCISRKLISHCKPIYVASYYLGTPDKISGDNYIYYSPLRERENTPSFYVNDEKGMHDFGTDKHYSVISFIRDYYNISYNSAIEKLILDFDIKKDDLDSVSNPVNIEKTSKNISISLIKADKPKFIECYFDEEEFDAKPSDSYSFAKIKNRISQNNFTRYNSINEIADEFIRGKTCIPSAIRSNANKNWKKQQVFCVDFDNKVDDKNICSCDYRHITEDKVLDYCKET